MEETKEYFECPDDDTVDAIIAEVPSGILDSRSYYWTNFKYPGRIIGFDYNHFQHRILLGNLSVQCPIYIIYIYVHLINHFLSHGLE